MKERDFLEWFLAALAAAGWKAYHVPFPVRPVGGGKVVPEPRARGLCDVIAFRADPPRLILAELKGDGGQLSDAQREFMRLARGVADAISQALAPEAGGVGPRIVAAYSLRPGMEPMVEAMLRTGVLP